MNKQTKDEIIQQCIKETKIYYVDGGHFFSPTMKGINSLEVGKSKIISSPLNILIEWAYVQYTRIRALFKRLNNWLFPRRPEIVGTMKDAYLTGSLVFPSRYPPVKPVAHMPVALWARTKFLGWRKLAEGYTNEAGVFRLEFDLRAAVSWRNQSNLIFEVHEISRIQFNEKQPYRQFSVFHCQKFPKSDLTGMGYTLREISLGYWNYRTDTTIPRAKLNDDDGDPIQSYSQGREDAMIEQIIPIELTKLKHLEQIQLDPDSISIKSIQADYPINLTQCLEKHLPGYSRSDEWFGDRMMNGMNCGTFVKDPKEEGVFIMKYFGICDYDHNDIYALPDVIIRYRLDEKGAPIPFKITTIGALNSLNRDQWQTRDFTPADGEMLWLAAKRIARMTGSVCVEVDQHFTGTHLNVEQYAIAAYRNLRRSPLAILMLPHMQEVALINGGADKLIIEGFLPEGTAMKVSGLLKRTKDVLGMLDWKGWKTMEPISEAHQYARGEKLFMSVLDEFVDKFFAENLDEIILHWSEAYNFSCDLIEHSVPVFLSDRSLDTMPENLRNQYKERYEYYKAQFGFDDSVKRELVNGELKTVSRITTKRIITSKDTEDIENLKNACKYAIMQATYMHTWINENQYDELGEVLYSGGGFRFGDKESGVLVPENDLTVAPTPEIATKQLWFANFLSRTEYGFIVTNEDKDVHPEFREALISKREEFQALGIDINVIESRTNI